MAAVTPTGPPARSICKTLYLRTDVVDPLLGQVNRTADGLAGVVLVVEDHVGDFRSSGSWYSSRAPGTGADIM